MTLATHSRKKSKSDKAKGKEKARDPEEDDAGETPAEESASHKDTRYDKLNSKWFINTMLTLKKIA